MEFIVSNQELSRRKKAFAALLISLSISTVVFSYLLNFYIPPIVLLLVGVVFVVIYLITYRYLSSLSTIQIRIIDHMIERRKGSNTEKYSLDEISSLKAKRRTDGIIRELYISFTNNKRLHISALEGQFEKFKDSLLEKTHNKIPLKEVREPLDFDNILFYPFLGLTIGCFGVLFFKLMIQANNSSLRIIFFAFSAYTLFLAVFFILKKPISAGSGKDQAITDYIFGTIMFLGSIFMAIIALLIE